MTLDQLSHQIREKRLARLQQQANALATPSDPATPAQTSLPPSTDSRADKQLDGASIIRATEPTRATTVLKETKNIPSNHRSITSFAHHVLHQVLQVTLEVIPFLQVDLHDSHSHLKVSVATPSGPVYLESFVAELEVELGKDFTLGLDSALTVAPGAPLKHPLPWDSVLIDRVIVARLSHDVDRLPSSFDYLVDSYHRLLEFRQTVAGKKVDASLPHLTRLIF